MKQPPIKTKELSGSTVQIADGQNWEIVCPSRFRGQ